MRLILDLSLTLAIAVILGLGSALVVLQERSAQAFLSTGAWTAQPGYGAPTDDPYADAIAATAVVFPLGAAEGIAFAASTTSAGEPLSGRCDYTVRGQPLPARLWTLTAYDEAGALMPSPSARTGFHSREILRGPGGTFSIAVSAQPQAGNWLPVSPTRNLRLVLRLYDSPLTTGLLPDDFALPEIMRGSCR